MPTPSLDCPPLDFGLVELCDNQGKPRGSGRLGEFVGVSSFCGAGRVFLQAPIPFYPRVGGGSARVGDRGPHQPYTLLPEVPAMDLGVRTLGTRDGSACIPTVGYWCVGRWAGARQTPRPMSPHPGGEAGAALEHNCWSWPGWQCPRGTPLGPPSSLAAPVRCLSSWAWACAGGGGPGFLCRVLWRHRV